VAVVSFCGKSQSAANDGVVGGQLWSLCRSFISELSDRLTTVRTIPSATKASTSDKLAAEEQKSKRLKFGTCTLQVCSFQVSFLNPALKAVFVVFMGTCFDNGLCSEVG
jgi:hypothetical protein